MTLADFIEMYSPNYQKRLEELKRKYAWRSEGIPESALLKMYNSEFECALRNYKPNESPT